MKQIDFTDVGIGILIACWGIGNVISTIGDNTRVSDCDKRGGVLKKVDDSWGAPKVCAALRAKP